MSMPLGSAFRLVRGRFRGAGAVSPNRQRHPPDTRPQIRSIPAVRHPSDSSLTIRLHATHPRIRELTQDNHRLRRQDEEPLRPVNQGMAVRRPSVTGEPPRSQAGETTPGRIGREPYRPWP